MPSLANDIYEDLLRDQTRRNLERLSQFEPPPPPPPPAPAESAPGPQPQKTQFEKLSQAVTYSLNKTKSSSIWSRLRHLIATWLAQWIREIGAMLGAPRIMDFGLALKLLKMWSYENMDNIDWAKRAQVFGGNGDIDWRLTMLPFLESIGMYLRDVQAHTNAWALYRDFRTGGRRDAQLEARAYAAYREAHTDIDKLAQAWGMRFVPLCDLCDVSPSGHARWDGPFCGMFITTERQADKPFVGIASKGTSPVNLKEWAVDVNYQLVSPAREYFDGRGAPVSQGVYTSLFGTYDHPAGRGAVVRTTRSSARRAPRPPSCPARAACRSPPTSRASPSAGRTRRSATRSCWPTWLRRSRGPGAGEMVMANEYTFRAPRVGSNEWAGLASRLARVQRGRSWRIVNNHDLVPQVPPTTLQPKQTDFHHVDMGMHVFPHKVPVQLPSEIDRPNPNPYPIYSILYLIPSLIMVLDHLPHRYYESLEYAIDHSGRVVNGPPLKDGLDQVPYYVNMLKTLYYSLLSYIHNVVFAIASVFQPGDVWETHPQL